MAYLYNPNGGVEWVCGLYFVDRPGYQKYLPRVSLSVHSRIIGTTSRSVLTQTFVNPQDKSIPELRYTFPLYDGVSVVGFVCTVNKDRIIRGTVKEREQARQTFKAAVARGETAGLLEQLPKASDVFTTTIGNIPAGAEVKVEVTYLGELKHDAETDGIRFTIPTKIAPRYGGYQREVLSLTGSHATAQSGIEIVVDAEMPNGSNIKSVQSPSHPISVTIGNTSLSTDAEMSLQKASATLSLGTAELDKDFVVHVVATNTSNPVAVLETHPTIPNQRALMATLVPKFNLPPARPEIVFVCDRSGSMTSNISNLKAALRIFLKSLPLGVKFNICSFGSHYEFLFKNGSRSYDATSLEEAERYIETFSANFGGTEMYRPVEDTFKKRYKDMSLEVFLLTDGEIWDQENLLKLINTHVEESKGEIRLFTLGIGSGVSHALIEGVARAGNGFAQVVGDNEKMNSKVLRMLKASLSPHVKDYTLEIKYGNTAQRASADDDDFELIEKVMDSLSIEVAEDPASKTPAAAPASQKPISLFDNSADPDTEMVDASLDQSAGGKYAHVPPVSEPKILQAPFNIPPLYPFSRTSVYLLLSAQSPQKEIKSVVLRGTCAHGPLELEIPVTVLPEKGETIHQLAAKKAVGELEEGRGWIFHAKDAKDNGKLLKDKFQGRFSDMVEREAVRLGVAFQVGGKWCSFVAVEEKEKEKEQPPVYEEIEPVQQKIIAHPTSSLYGASTPAQAPPIRRSFMPQMQYSAPPPPGGGALFGGPVPPPPPAPPMMMASRYDTTPSECNESIEEELSRNTIDVDFSMDFANPLSSADVLNDFDFDSFLAEGGVESEHALDMIDYSDHDDDDQEDGCGFALMDDFVDVRAESAVRPQAKTSANISADSAAFPQQEAVQQVQMTQMMAGRAQAQAQCSAPPPPRPAVQQLQRMPAPSPSPSAPAPAPASSFSRSMFSALAAPIQARRSAVDKGSSSSSMDRLRKKSKSSSSAKESASASASSNASDGLYEQKIVDVDTRDTFEKLVSLQSFAGSWSWSEQLLGILGVAVEGKLAAVLQGDNGQISKIGQTDLLATALVIAFLEKKMGGRKDEWELLVDKARDWAAGELASVGVSGLDVEELVSKVGVVF